jgi:ribosomal protein S18 acetylase RimI-like enzyme
LGQAVYFPALGEMQLADVTRENIEVFKHLHNCLFPVAFSRKFFKDIVKNSDEQHLPPNKIVSLNGKLVGVVSSRVEETSKGRSLYISSLGCKILYRRQGVGSLLLETVLDWSANNGCGRVYLHVQTTNESAINFYTKLGFEMVEEVANFYPRLEPSTAIILEKRK